MDENNVVLEVTRGDNNDPDEGYKWLIDNLGGTWLKTSYTGAFRVNYAGIGYTYDEALDAFIPPKPEGDWVLDEATCQWVEPK
jgi:hypothetical protein